MAKNPIIYVTKDKERADGIPETDSYSIISGDGTIDTLELLSLPETLKMIKEKKANILVFKNNIQIEELAKEKKFKILNPSAVLAEKVENKITQVAWLGKVASLLPLHTISLVKDINWEKSGKKPFILQWAHSHTGDGTLLIQNENDLNILPL